MFRYILIYLYDIKGVVIIIIVGLGGFGVGILFGWGYLFRELVYFD